MRTLKLAGIALAAVMSFSTAFAADEAMPPMPQPTAEHQWLQQMVGEWTSENHAVMDPSQPAVVSSGWESVRRVGPFWTVSEVKASMMDQPFTGNLTLGYDEQKQKFVGTWVDSMTGRLWEYEGTLNEAGDTLTLEAEGECPMNPGRITKFREQVIMKDPNHKVFKSAMLDENGNWVTMMTGYSTRQK